MKKRKAGRPLFVPTEEDRRLVRALAGYGADQDYMASKVINPQTGKPISRKTLARSFEAEIAGAAAEADLRVVESLYHQAVGRPAQYDEKGNKIRAEMPPHHTPGIWWTKARMGWSEQQSVAVTHSGSVEVSSARERFNRKIDELRERNLARGVARIAHAAGATAPASEAVRD